MAAHVEQRAFGGTSTRLAYYSSQMLRQLHARFAMANALCALLPGFASGAIRARMYRAAGLNVAPGAFIMGNLDLAGGDETGEFYNNLNVEPGAVIGNHVTINVDAAVKIGANVTVGPFVRIYTGTHPIGPGSRRCFGPVLAKPVAIGEGSWVGLGSLILPGVTLGRGCVVAAGSVVHADVPANVYVEGNPARPVRELPWGNR